MEQNGTDTYNPKVSVIVAAYGQEEFLSETLESLLVQDYQNWEAIVTDDDSPDNVDKVVKSYCEKDKRIRFIHSKNLGAAGVRNMAVEHASGDYLLMLDGDDWIDSDYIGKCVAAFYRNSELKVVFGNLTAFGTQNYTDNVTYHSYPALLINNPLFNCGLIRKKDFIKIGGLDSYFKRGLEDWEFWIRFLKDTSNKCVKILKDTTFHYRKKEHSITTNLDKEKSLMNDYRHRIFEKHADIYHKYFGAEIKEWMLMERNFLAEIRYLLQKPFMDECVESGVMNKELLSQVMRIGADGTLTPGQRLSLLRAIEKRQTPNLIRNGFIGLSLKRRLRWKLLRQSPELFIKYAEWKRK